MSVRGTAMARPATRSYSRPPAEVVGEVVAHAEAVVGGDGDVAGVEEAVDVGAQQQSVGERVLAAVCVGAHVGGLERGQRVLSRHGAAARCSAALPTTCTRASNPPKSSPPRDTIPNRP